MRPINLSPKVQFQENVLKQRDPAYNAGCTAWIQADGYKDRSGGPASGEYGNNF